MTLIDNLTAYYKLDGTSGAVVDELGLYDGTNVGATRGVTGKIVDAFSFTTDDYVSFTNNTFFQPINNFAIQAWIKSNGGGGVIFATSEQEGTPNYFVNGINLLLQTDGKILLQTNDGDGYQNVVSDISGLNDNSYHHIVVSVDAGSFATLYVDKIVVGSGQISPGYTGNNKIYIGVREDVGPPRQNFLNGTVDELGLWKTGLSSDDVNNLWNNGDGLLFELFSKTNVEDTVTITEDISIERTKRSHLIDVEDSISISDSLKFSGIPQTYQVDTEDELSLTEDIGINRIGKKYEEDLSDILGLSEDLSITVVKPDIDCIIDSLLKVDGVQVERPLTIDIKKTMDEFNATSSFSFSVDNYSGRSSNLFNLNQEVTVYADVNTSPPTTKIFTGIIEDIKYGGKQMKERITVSGRDYGAILQDIMVNPRRFKNTEISKIVTSLLVQNLGNGSITWDNINVTSVTLDEISFNNMNLYDALRQLAEQANFYFYIDIDKDLHFEERSSISSGETFSKGNTLVANFTKTDADIFNRVIVNGDRVMTGFREEGLLPTAVGGSEFILDSKPSNVSVAGSDGSLAGSIIQPGGVLNFDDPATKDVRWLVGFDDKKIVLTNGLAGDFTGWAGSGINVDYQRSTPLIYTLQDVNSINAYGRKDKVIIDNNVKTLIEAQNRASTYLLEHKNPKIMGDIETFGVLNITPGHTCNVDFPYYEIHNQTYTILEAKYSFNKRNNLANKVLKIKLNKKVRDFIDYFKEQELRLRNLESANVSTALTETLSSTGSIIMAISTYDVIQRSIGSAFYFGVSNHNVLDSPSSLIGDMRAGSTVVSFP